MFLLFILFKLHIFFTRDHVWKLNGSIIVTIIIINNKSRLFYNQYDIIRIYVNYLKYYFLTTILTISVFIY